MDRKEFLSYVKQIEEVMEEMLDDEYEQGYEDGYDAGYERACEIEEEGDDAAGEKV